MLRIPHAEYLVIALLIPTVIAYVGPLAFYVYARVLGSTHGWGTQISPLPRNFLGLPAVSSTWYFLPALVEEIGWRGHLQPHFIRRSGLVRGIFLVGVVWGAFHFFWDSNSSMPAQDVGIKLVVRLAGTISLSYVLAWVTIRSGSILPVAAAHGPTTSSPAGRCQFTTPRGCPFSCGQFAALPFSTASRPRLTGLMNRICLRRPKQALRGIMSGSG